LSLLTVIILLAMLITFATLMTGILLVVHNKEFEAKSCDQLMMARAGTRAAADALISASLKLAEIAKSGDLELFKAQFQVVEQACRGCHAFTPSQGGKFKFPK